MIISDGQFVKGPTTLWAGTTAQLDTWGGHYASYWPTAITYQEFQWGSYSHIYRAQLWPYVLVNKLARGTARLPLKVYERGTDGRNEVRDHAYSQLLRDPCPFLDPFAFWEWTAATAAIYGEAFWIKVRDTGGRPISLIPMHPTKVKGPTRVDGRMVYEIRWNADTEPLRVDESDIVPFVDYNPDEYMRGVSPLEPLRSTLENEAAARTATASFWARGARPGFALSHPGNLSEGAGQRVKAQFDAIAAGAGNTGTTVVLEEGMKPEVLSLTAEEAQYIETRKLNREEVCAAYDVPPPVVHILDHATYSNITEQMRSMYRDTMAPRLNKIEAVLDKHLRGSVRPGASEPDFGASVYAEFLMDEVLRGDFETRVQAWATAIQTGQATPAEARSAENRPFVEGTDQLLVNQAVAPITSASTAPAKDAVESIGALVRAGFEPEAVAAMYGANIPHTGDKPVTTRDDPPDMRALMGRLSRVKSLDDIDPDALDLSPAARQALDEAKAAGDDIAAFRSRIKALEA